MNIDAAVSEAFKGHLNESKSDKKNKQLSISDLSADESIDAAVNSAFSEQNKIKNEKASKETKLSHGFAAVADTALNMATGTLDYLAYGPVRAYYGLKMPAHEAAEMAKQQTTSPKNIIGRSLEIEDAPGYKGEASQKLIQFIGEHMDKGVDWITGKTGLPKSDVESYVNSVGALVGAKAAPKIAKTVGKEAGYIAKAATSAADKVAPNFVKKAATSAAEFVAPGSTGGKIGTSFDIKVPPQTTKTKPINIETLKEAMASASPEFQQLYSGVPINKLNAQSVLKHLEADSLDVPVRLTGGQASGDIVKISNEQNMRGANPKLANRFNEQNKALIENLQVRKEKAAPDVVATKTIESSEAIIDAYKKIDEAKQLEIREAYKAVEDAAGGNFPFDANAFVSNAQAALSKKLKSDFLPPPIKKQLSRIKQSKNLSFEQFEALRTNLASEMRKADRAGDGNASMAMSIVRDALEDMPLTGEAKSLKPLADNARALAKSRFDALKQDPAYKAAVDDSVPADKYFDKYIIGGVNKNIKTMIDNLGVDSLANQHMRAGVMNWLSDKANVQSGNFSGRGYNKALKKLDDVRNLEAIFDIESQQKLKTLGNVADYTQAQVRGSFVNNSNTFTSYLAGKSKKMAEQMANIAGLKTAGYPFGTRIKKRLDEMRQTKQVDETLSPGAGSFNEE